VSSLEIVEVTTLRRRAGERITEDDFLAFPLRCPNFEDDRGGPALTWETVICPYLGHLGEYRECVLPCDWAGLRFRFVGSGFGVHYLSNLEADHDEAGPAEAFGDWAEDLIAIGDKLLDAERERRGGTTIERDYGHADIVTFLTLWEDATTVDYEGEVNVSYDLLGLIDPAKLRLTLKEGE
jgi:hypothetical protein